MAEEEIIILETSEDTDDAELKKERKKKKNEADDKKKKKKLLIIGGAGLFVVILIIVILVIVFSGSDEDESYIDTDQIAKKLQKKSDFGQFSPSHLENMIKKANLLYEGGNKDEALTIYKRISTYNEAISHYNIGVAQLKENLYKDALTSFKKAIDNEEQRCVSAINSAVCALELNEEELFKYYIDLAFTYLPMESNSPLYSYYVGLINYYKNYSYESLVAFSNKSSEFYDYEQNYLASKILSSVGLDNRATNIFEAKAKTNDSLTLGLLYARLGEYKVAQKYLIKANGHTENPDHVKAALVLVNNKLGQLKSSATLMDELIKKDTNTTKIYPIKTTLRKSLFDINYAQKEFNKALFFDNKKTYSLLFYFAPFKVFNAKQTINYIRKGSMNVFIDEIGPAMSYLKRSSTISKVNISISDGIKKALSHHTEQANEIFLKTIDAYPKHSILHYNLALTYAQMADFGKAYKHFKKSYHLNNNNYLAGAFAVMSGVLIKEDITKLKEDVKASMNNHHKLKETNIYMSLLHLTENNQLSLARWIETDKNKAPLNIALDIIIAHKIFNEKEYRQKAALLKSILPKDIIANIINFNVKYKTTDIKTYAKAIQIYFRKLDLDHDSFYYGSRIAQETYVKLLQIGGILHHERKKLIKKVELENNDAPAIIQTLAYMSIYTHHFEEAYILYNQLIDDMNKSDSATIFYAAVASIGAGHSENAVALLELSKLTDPNNYEARYGLGLLYQQIRNWEGASIQYKNIEDDEFQSKYFSFEVVR